MDRERILCKFSKQIGHERSPFGDRSGSLPPAPFFTGANTSYPPSSGGFPTLRPLILRDGASLGGPMQQVQGDPHLRRLSKSVNAGWRSTCPLGSLQIPPDCLRSPKPPTSQVQLVRRLVGAYSIKTSSTPRLDSLCAVARPCRMGTSSSGYEVT